ncbi:uncharacterized protein TNCV_1568591 [Trichonephila clavipes]|nr:uncharacterized protein TNCV_1568591 [Trichonephila clavipes]
MARIVRHNDESVREGYIRNGGKEVKLFTSALKAFQCNNRIVMAQRKHLDDFLRGRIIGLECGRTQLKVSEELGIAQSVISRLWQRFQDDGNVCELHFSDDAIRRYTKGGNILGMAYNSEQAATSAYVFMIQSSFSS